MNPLSPKIQKLFARIIGVLILVLIVVPSGMSGGLSENASAAADTILLAEYRFDNNFNDSQGGSTLNPLGSTPDSKRCNATQQFNVDHSWTWSAAGCGKGGGLVIDVDQDISAGYTVAVRFKYNQTGPGWRKIIDFKNKINDTGFYFNSGHIKFYNHSELGSTVFLADTVYDLVATRDAGTNRFKAYIVPFDSSGNALPPLLELDIDDSGNGALPVVLPNGKTRLGFFFDDNLPTDSNEATDGGTVYGIKIWKNALSADQIQNAVSNQTPIITSNGGGDTGNTSLFEGTTAVTTVAATDVDGDTLTYGIIGGADAAQFTINPSSGALTFTNAPAYSPAGDADGDNHYEVTVQADDGRGGTKTQDLTVEVRLNGLQIDAHAAIDYPWHAAPLVVAPNLSIDFATAPAIDQAKVDISSNYQSGGDVLGIQGQTGTSGTVDGLSWKWDATLGVLTLSGSGTEATYQGALRKVTFYNSHASPVTLQRTVNFSLGSGLQYPGTGHFYEFVPSPLINWTDAKNGADGKTYYGLQGYLVTVTSQAESDFILGKLEGKQGWIGGSDSLVQTEWRWVTGPEGLEDGGNGRHFSNNGTPVGGNFVNWMPGQPDNSGDAVYFIGKVSWQGSVPSKWDDVPVTETSFMQGYVTEYGGMPGDPAIHLADNALINVVAPDLSITKSASTAIPIAPGQPLVYTLNFSNAGSAAAPGVMITETVPAELTNVSYTSSGVTVINTGAAPPYVWQVLDLAPGQSGEIRISGELKTGLAAGLTFTNTATISTSGMEFRTDNNSSSVVNQVAEVPAMLVNKTPSDISVEVGDTITYTYKVTNSGNVSLSGLAAVDDQLGAVTLDKTTLDVGEIAQGQLTHTVLELDLPGPLINSVVVTGTTPLAVQTQASHGTQVELTTSPAIIISKTPNAVSAEVGDTITYTYQVNNPGDVTLNGIIVNDSILGIVTLDTSELPPGTSTQGQLTHTVMDSDLPGPLVNTVLAIGTSPTGHQVGDSDSASVSLTSHPNISVSKTASVSSAEVGDTIVYTYKVTNTGNTRLKSIMVTDNLLGNVTIEKTSLSKGRSTVGTLSYTVLESDLPGPLVNKVVAMGIPANGGPVTTTDSASVDLTSRPAIAVNKSASIDTAQVRETITYTYVVTNTGDVSLNNIVAFDDQLGSVTLGAASLAPGASTQGQLATIVLESDLPGPLSNVVHVSGESPLGTTVTDIKGVLVSVTSKPAIAMSKTANVISAEPGDSIIYTYEVTNPGNVNLSNITAVDDKLGPIPLKDSSLTPGGITSGQLTYTVLEGDLAGPLVNNVVVTGITLASGSVIIDDNVSIMLTSTPDIALSKTASVTTAEVGETITYSYLVTNLGNVTLRDIIVNDNMLGKVALDATTLAPKASTQGQLKYTVLERDLPGPLVNRVDVTGNPLNGVAVIETDIASVDLTSTPAIAVNKTANVDSAQVGDSITYTYVVTNSGNVSLSSITAVDNKLGAVALDDTALAVGASTQGQLTYTVLESDLPGPLDNTVDVSGETSQGTKVTTSKSMLVLLTSTPAIAVSKTADVPYAWVGDTITYTYVVTNTGDVTLSNVTAIDYPLGAVTLGAASLAPGAATTGTLIYTVLAGDLPGPLVNNVIVTGRSATSVSVISGDQLSVPLTSSPAIAVNKTANVTVAEVGDTISYTYVVTNTGNITLNALTAVDDQLGPVTLGDFSLAPGASTNGTLTYTVLGSDLPGPLVNKVEVTGDSDPGGSVSGDDTLSVTLANAPAIAVSKTANVTSAKVGDSITYTYMVTNTGNSELHAITAVDDRLGPVTLGKTSLTKGESTTGTLSYTVLLSDLPGPLVNKVDVEGIPVFGPAVTSSDSSSVDLIPSVTSKTIYLPVIFSKSP